MAAGATTTALRQYELRRGWFDLGLGRPSRQAWFAYLLLLPAALLIVAFIVYPLFVSFDLSLQNVNMARIGDPRRPFTFANYLRLFRSDEFWGSVLVTFELIFTVTVCCFAIGIGTALLLNNRFRGRRLARLLVALPWAVPEVVAVVIFAWLFDSSFGLVSWLLVKLGLTREMVAWFSDPAAAFTAVSITMIWKAYPFVSTMALAGLQSIPDDLYGAARVDGATARQQFRHVTLPSLLPVIAITAVLLVLWLFRDFSIVYVMTQGGPVRATQTLSIMTYQQAFSFFRMGYASAVGVVTLVLCLLAGLLLVGRRTDSIY